MTKIKRLYIRMSESELATLQMKAKRLNMGVSEYVRNVLFEDCTNTQLRIQLTEMENVLANILLGSKITAARMDEFYKSVTTRMAEKDVSKLTQEEKTKTQEGVESRYERCVNNSVEKVVSNYSGGDEDPLYLNLFEDKMLGADENEPQ